MISFLLFIFVSAVLLGMGIKHDELILIVVAYTFGLFIAFSYGRFIELKRAHNLIQKLTRSDND